MRRATLIVLAALLALALVLAGCGGSSSSTSTGPTVSSFKAAFAAEKAQLKALGTDVGTAVEGAAKQTDTALASQFRSLASRATALAGSLGQLSAPAQYKAELAALQSSVTQVAGGAALDRGRSRRARRSRRQGRCGDARRRRPAGQERRQRAQRQARYSD